MFHPWVILRLTKKLRTYDTFVRLRSKTKFSKSDQPFNSLQKIKRQYCYDEDTNRIATRICVSVLGNGAIGQPNCLCLFTEFKCYMFNCGEGTMRLCREHTEDLLFIKHVFITEKSWKNMSGLPDVYLTLQQYNLKRFTVHGPSGVENFIEMVSSQQKKVAVDKRGISDSPFKDHSVEIDYVPIYKNQMSSMNHRLRNNSNPPNASGRFSDCVMSYICKIKPRPGEFSPEKCVELGVPVGPLLLDLKNGNDIELPLGKLVRSSDVHEHSDPASMFLVVDCPADYMIDNFVQEQKLCPYHISATEKEFGDICAVFHFSPPRVMNSYKYVQWMNKFPESTLHIALNSLNSTLSSETIHRTQHILHHIHPVIFPIIQEKPRKESHDSSPNIIQADPLLKYYLRPEKMLDRGNVVNLDVKQYIQSAYDTPMFDEHVKQFHSTLKSKNCSLSYSQNPEDYPEVVFLGTSSSASTPYRNVSAILVNASADNSILLDCGEGTYNQFLRYFGFTSIDAALKRISCIFLSHHHSDHFLGLFTLIKARKKAFLRSQEPYVPVAVMTTRYVEPFIKSFHRYFEPIRDDIKQFSNSYYSSQYSSSNNELESLLKGVNLLTVPVQHCRDSYGVVLTAKDWKIVYSGDAAPSQSLVDAGKDCTLLIHEASIEDELINEAAVKMHTTPSQVVEMAELMNAKYSILTHFSKRYLNVPLFPESDRVGCAFDHMRVRIKDLPVLPLLIPTLKCFFEEERNTFVDRATAVVNFEKVFFKTYKR